MKHKKKMESKEVEEEWEDEEEAKEMVGNKKECEYNQNQLLSDSVRNKDEKRNTLVNIFTVVYR